MCGNISTCVGNLTHTFSRKNSDQQPLCGRSREKTAGTDRSSWVESVFINPTSSHGVDSNCYLMLHSGALAHQSFALVNFLPATTFHMFIF